MGSGTVARSAYALRWFSLLLLLSAGRVFAAVSPGPPPAGEFDNGACIDCHRERDAALVAAWRESPHGAADAPADCVACHGSSHDNAAPRARSDTVCIDCHGGARAAVVHSYTTSKHGVLVRLEGGVPDRPLRAGNYRAPGCAYCHLHAGSHGLARITRRWQAETDTPADAPGRVRDAVRAVCQDCHGPRYVARLLDNGEGMLAIGRMKVREAAAVRELAVREFGDEGRAAVDELFATMRSRHLRNLYLGIGHQSPDYQWWHGQPALDGDLLRIKGALGRLRRLRAITDAAAEDAP